MKRTALLLPFVVMCLAPRTGHADVPLPDRIDWTIQVDPLTTALGIAHILVERRVADHVAVYIGPSLRLYDSPLTPDDEEGYNAYGAEFGARWFFRGDAPGGWWAGLRGVVAHLTFEDESELGGYASALAGYAWIIDDRWVLSGALGVSHFWYDVGDVGVSGVLPGAHTAVGFAF